MNSKNEVGQLLTQKDVAKIYGLSIAWMERARWEGTGPRYIKFGHAVRYRFEDVQEYLDKRLTTSTSEAGGK